MVDNHVFTIAGAKGGVGKTTTTLNLAAALHEQNYSVVAVEMDLPMPNFVDFLDFDFDPDEDLHIHNVLDDDADHQSAIYETPDGLSVIPSASDMETFDRTDLSQFPEIIDELRWYFDIVLIDTPAGLSEESKQSLLAGDEALIVSTPRVASIQNANKTIEFAHQQDADVGGFLLNKSGSGASPGVDTIADAVDVEVLGHIPEDDAVPHAQDSGEPVVTHSPNSAAAIAYKRLASSVVDSDQDSQSNPATHEPPVDPSDHTITTDDNKKSQADQDSAPEEQSSTVAEVSDASESTDSDGINEGEDETPSNELTEKAEGGDSTVRDQESDPRKDPDESEKSTTQSETILGMIRRIFRFG